jgi:polar amino acid transport system substrate-binding protein
MRRLFVQIASLCWLLAVATPAFADDSLAKVLKAGQLRIGVSLTASWVIKKDGKLVGFDIDLVTAMANDLGVKANFVEMPFADLLTRLEKGDVDMVASGLAITGQRARDVVFSAPTGVAEVRVVAATNTEAAALSRKDAVISVLEKSTDEAAARATFPQAKILSYTSEGEALAALVAGKAQAMAATEPVPQMTEHLYGARFRQIGRPLARTAEAFALAPDAVRLQAFVNNWIAARVADGFLENARGYWFNSFEWLATAEGGAATAPTPAKP